MDITKEKSDVFSQIAALRVSAEGYPKSVISNITNSIESIKQEANSLDFLTDLAKSLIGFEAIKETLVDALTHNLDDIESDIKKAIKKALKAMVSCSINPSIPQSFIDDGITVELDKIDLLDIFKIDPTSDAGKLLYNDITTGANSTDFNTFAYNTIQDDGNTGIWGLSTTGNEILQIRFDEVGPINNTLNIKPSDYYSSGTKKLPDLNNDYIDSIKLFNSNKLINNIIESVFGVISLNVSKDKNQIKNEIRIEDIIDRILNSDCDVVIDNSYFAFSNEELASIDYRADVRRKGMRIVSTCGDMESSVSFDTLTDLNDELDALADTTPSPELIQIQTTIVREGLDNLANDSAENVEERDKLNVKISFIENMLKHLMTAIVSGLLAPKLIVILAVNHSIVHGEVFDNTEDFIRKNSGLVTAALQSVRDAVVALLMERILKEIKTLVLDNVIKTQIERVKFQKAQLASLVGIPQDILRQISGLAKN
jgi:hypothetical protein